MADKKRFMIDVDILMEVLGITSEEEYNQLIKRVKFRKELLENGILSKSTYIEKLIENEKIFGKR